jgi:hypothetical protein
MGFRLGFYRFWLGLNWLLGLRLGFNRFRLGLNGFI